MARFFLVSLHGNYDIKNMQQAVRKSRAESNGVQSSGRVYHLVVDGNSVLKSSLVNKECINSRGQEYGAILLFLYRVGKLLTMRDFSRCCVVWDGFNSGSLRWQIYPEYKANRDKHYEEMGAVSNPKSDYDAYIEAYCRKVLEYHRKNKEGLVRRGETDDENFQRQRSILQEILDELFVRQYMYENVEGDDLISYYCMNKRENDYIVIVSEDRDISQLIRNDICLYIPSIKKFVTPDNSVEVLGMPSSNIALMKIICGDASDNIKGIKGIGETTLKKYYPQILEEGATLEGFLGVCRGLLDSRKAEKKKPLLCLENALNEVTDASNSGKAYEINRKIVDLTEPILTDEAREELCEIFDAPIDPQGRDVKNVYRMIEAHGMTELLNESKFGNLFGRFERVRNNEINYWGKC